MKKKIDNLKLLLYYYDNDINLIINNLNKIYDDYRDIYNLKAKEELKLLKKEGKKFFEMASLSNYLKQINIIKTIKLYRNAIKKEYFYFFIFIIVITLIIYLINIIVWILTFQEEQMIGEWEIVNERVLNVTNILLNNYLSMIYNNQTIDEISIDYQSDNYISFIFNELTPLYTNEKYNKYLNNIFNSTSIDSINCNYFYDDLDNEIFRNLRYLFIEESYRFNYTFSYFCLWFNTFMFDNYKIIYLELFSVLQKAMESFNNRNYSNIIEYINQKDILKIDIMYMTLYIYILDNTLNNIKNAVLLMIKKIGKRMIITYTISYPLLFASIFVIFFVYVRNINNDCNKFINIRKIFKVCNTI
jgi:hypothetical protein